MSTEKDIKLGEMQQLYQSLYGLKLEQLGEAVSTLLTYGLQDKRYAEILQEKDVAAPDLFRARVIGRFRACCRAIAQNFYLDLKQTSCPFKAKRLIKSIKAAVDARESHLGIVLDTPHSRQEFDRRLDEQLEYTYFQGARVWFQMIMEKDGNRFVDNNIIEMFAEDLINSKTSMHYLMPRMHQTVNSIQAAIADQLKSMAMVGRASAGAGELFLEKTAPLSESYRSFKSLLSHTKITQSARGEGTKFNIEVPKSRSHGEWEKDTAAIVKWIADITKKFGLSEGDIKSAKGRIYVDNASGNLLYFLRDRVAQEKAVQAQSAR